MDSPAVFLGEFLDKRMRKHREHKLSLDLREHFKQGRFRQKDKLRAQVGASVVPTITHNETNGSDYNSTVVNWSPSAMIWYDINDNMNLRGFYFGNSSQPSTSQLMPVPNNSNPDIHLDKGRCCQPFRPL